MCRRPVSVQLQVYVIAFMGSIVEAPRKKVRSAWFQVHCWTKVDEYGCLSSKTQAAAPTALDNTSLT